MFQQVVIFLSAVALVSSLGYSSKKNDYQKPSQYASVASFHSSQPAAPQPQAAPSPYSFGYESDGSARQESADASGKVTGSYSVTNEDGSVRLVKYVADADGFRADVDTNEPGTKTHSSASANVKSAFVEPSAPSSKKFVAPPAQVKTAHKTNYESKTNHESKTNYEQKPVQYSNSGYSFNYKSQLDDGGSSAHSETSDGSGRVTGYYSLSGADGRRRQVDYQSGSNGFQAKVDTNEFGTKSDSPAHVQFYSSAPQQQEAPARTGFSKTHHQQQKTHEYTPSEIKQQPIQSHGFTTPFKQEPIKTHTYATSPAKQETISEFNKPSPYSFNYDAQLEDGSSSRTETADGSGKVIGSYSLTAADGRKRVIDYTADQDGFRATVNTNEFGTKSDSPAHVQFYSNAPLEAPTHYGSAEKFSQKKIDHFAQKPSISQPFSQKQVEPDHYVQKPTITEPFSQKPAISQPFSQKPAISQPFSQKQVEPDHYVQKPTITEPFSQKPAISQPFSQKTVQTSYPGQSAIQYSQDSYAPYNFNYVAELDDGSSARSESGDGSGKVIGSYSLSGSDGRQRTVDYSADHAGFRATVQTNEFGTKSDSPADVQFYSSAPQQEEAPVKAYEAPKAYPMSYSAGQPQRAMQYGSQQTTFTQQKFDDAFQPSPYSFGYEADSAARSESGDASGAVTGSYSVVHEDGSKRLVEYIADANGFRANVKTNEHGTKADESPADAVFTSAGGHRQSSSTGHQQSQFPAPTYSQKTISQQKVWRRR